VRFDARAREASWTAAFALFAAIFVLTILYWGFGGKAKAQLTASLPVVTTTTLGASAAQIIAVNPSRRAIQICTATAAITIAPVNPGSMAPVTPSATIGIPVATGGSNCYNSPLSTLSSGSSGGAGAAWQAFGNTAVVTVLEY
jgi:hypothetical protein